MFLFRRNDVEDISIPTLLRKFVLISWEKLEGRKGDSDVKGATKLLKGLVLELELFRRIWMLPTSDTMDHEKFVKKPVGNNRFP